MLCKLTRFLAQARQGRARAEIKITFLEQFSTEVSILASKPSCCKFEFWHYQFFSGDILMSSILINSGAAQRRDNRGLIMNSNHILPISCKLVLQKITFSTNSLHDFRLIVGYNPLIPGAEGALFDQLCHRGISLVSI